jgi:pimeloyl-ACP methyl ester carboxylesterase
VIGVFNGTQIGYDDVGAGMPVVFLHGFPHDRSLWAAQLGALAVPTRTLACDLRGFGESGGTALSIDDYADDVAAWMTGLRLEPAVVVGLSMGGYVALALWRRYPALFRGIVLSNTRATPDDAAARAKRTEQIHDAESRGSELLADDLVQGMLGKTTRARRQEAAERVHAMLARASVDAIVGALRAMRSRADSTPTLATIGVPSLVISGDEDVLIPAADSRAMYERLEKSRLEVIAEAGHLPNVERPASFNHVLSEYLASLVYS